jgi:selenocysteine-specific elongation factor
VYVIGTAGHVDHGKTLLIEALTGINADRLPEEKRRGLTIDLGFAHFYTKQGEAVGVIDVPGHERFIRNMVAGAWSLDLALLTVAADDGWMQQSADHTRVLRLMGVPRLIAVITKTDLVSAERVRQVIEQATEECRASGYAGVPTAAVSAPSGRGIEALKGLILEQLAALPPPVESFAHIYVDRVFTVKGSGLVVTGSLRGGVLRRGEELLLLPREKRVRIRGLQSYYKECEHVEPVSRVAVNLSGIETEQISRGDCLTVGKSPLRVVGEFIARIRADSIKRDTELEIAVGTGHQIARLTRFSSVDLAAIRCSRQVPLLWNQPIVLIQQGGSAVLGGGRVLWLGKTNKQQRLILEQTEPTLPAELAPEHLAALKLALEGAIAPEQAKGLHLPAGLRQRTVELDGWIVSEEYRDRLDKRIRELAAAPGGVRIDELATKIRAESDVLQRLVAQKLVDRGDLTLRGGILFPAGGQSPQVSPMGRQLLRDLQAAGTRGLELSKLKIAGARKELRNLVRTDLAVSLDGDIYYEMEIYLGLARTCLADLELGSTLTISEAKTRTALSRKYIIPLLNRMERDGFVKRSGDERIVTGGPTTSESGSRSAADQG